MRASNVVDTEENFRANPSIYHDQKAFQSYFPFTLYLEPNGHGLTTIGNDEYRP